MTSLAYKLEFLITKYCIYQYNRFKNYNTNQKIRQTVAELMATIQKIPAEDEEVYDILKAKAHCIEWEEPFIRKTKISQRLYTNLRWSLSVFVRHKMQRLIVWTSERLLKDQDLNRVDKRSILSDAIRSAKLVKMEEKVVYFEKLEKELEQESESLDSKKIVFMNNFVIDTNPPYIAYILFNKELRKLLLEDIKKTGKDLVVQFTEFTIDNLKALVETSKGCRLCVVDAPIYGHETFTLRSDLTIDSRSDSVMESSVSYSTIKTDPLGQIDVLVVLGFIHDLDAKKLLEKIPVSYLVSLNFGEIVKNPLDLFNIVMASEFKYIFLQKLIKLFLSGTRIEVALEQIRQLTFDELRKNFKKHNMQHITEINNQEPIEMDPDFFFKDCIKIRTNSSNLKMRFEFKPGEIEEIPSIYTKSNFYYRMSEAIQRPDTIKRIIESLQKSHVVNLYGKRGLGKTVMVKLLYNQCTALEIYKDGVFIFDLKGFAEENPHGNIRELMRLKLGDAFEEDMDQFFSNKQMLIIFDDFHYITTKNLLVFPIHLIKVLTKHNIHIVLTSDHKLKNEEHIKKMRSIKLNRLTAEESLMLFLYSQNNLLVKLDGRSLDHALKSDIIRECKGFPQLIVQNAHKFTSKVLGILPLDLDRSAVFEGSDLDYQNEDSQERENNYQPRAQSEFNVIEESPGNILAPLPLQEFGRFYKGKPDNRKQRRRKPAPWTRESRNDKFKFD